MSAHGHTPEPAHTTTISLSLTLRFDSYELDFARSELRRAGALVALQPTPLRVLLYLAEHRGRTVPRRELLDAIWPGVVVGDEALTTALAEARHAVGDDGAAQRVIRTLKGQGYRFVAEGVVAIGARASANEAAFAAEQSAIGVATAADARSRSQRRTWIGAAGASLLIASVAAVALLRSRGEEPSAPAPYGIVVLPVSSLTGDARDQALANGLTEQITQTLAAAGFPVVARTTAAQWKERGADVRTLRDALGTSHVVAGGVQRDHGRVRATMELVATNTGQSLWSETFEYEDGDLFAIQDKVSARVLVQAFQYVLPDDIIRWNPEFAQLNRRFVEMFALFFKSRYEDHLLAGERLLKDMPQREPFVGLRSFTHAIMAVAWRNLWSDQHHAFRDASPEMLAHANAAVSLDSASPFAHHVLAQALIAHWRWEEAEREMRRACELAPRDGMSCGATMWMFCTATGCPEELVGAQLWQEQFSGQAAAWVCLSLALLRADRVDEAEAASLRAREMNESWGGAAHLLQWQRGKREEAAASLRRYAAAKGAGAFVREIERASPSGPAAVWKTAAALGASRDSSALAAFGNPACDASLMYGQLGDRELALRALERSFAEREACIEWYAASPLLDPIRETPRFRALIEQMGLTPYHEKYGVFERARQQVAGASRSNETAP